MSEPQDKFPPDDDQAEKGSYAESDSPDPEEHKPYEEFSRNAKSWAMYLQEAEENAKDQAEVWKTGLESLLIFAGLFAGVITSFLAESRKKLRLEDQEALLMDIRSALRNEPPSNIAYQPTPAQLWVNGLWFTSLLITLFSAIVGVLARSWLVNHLPISNRKEAADAYRRWRLDERAERWKLQKVITGIPLLVQLAFFLFSFGLAIQAYNDNETLGIFVLLLVAGGTLFYLVVTALPLLLPPDSCPFQTPLSEILRDLTALVASWFRPRYGSQPDSAPEAFADTLAKILYKDLISSRKPELTDEAILELSRRPPQQKRLQFFAASDTPAICVQRIRECTSMRFEDHLRRDEIIGAHLQVLLRLIASWEENGRDKVIGARFQRLIGQTGILGRWDTLPEPLRPLAYAVRVPLYLASDRDFENNLLPGREWETIVHYVQPTYRLRYVLSACRGTVQGKPNIQRVGLFSIAHLMAQGYIHTSQGRHTEWNSPGYEERVRLLCADYLKILSKNLAPMWKEAPATFLLIPSWLQLPPTVEATEGQYTSTPALKLSALSSPGYPPTNLLFALTSLEPGVRSQGNAVLVSLAEQGHVELSQMETLLSALFETMFDFSYKPNTVVQSIRTAADICTTIYKEVALKNLSGRIHKALESNLPEDPDLQRALEAVEQISHQSQRPMPGSESQGIEEALWILAPRLVEIDLTVKSPVPFQRWGWLKILLAMSSGDQELRYRSRIREALLLELVKVFRFEVDSEGPEEGPIGSQGSIIGRHVLLESLADLLSFRVFSWPNQMPVLDFETLEQALAPNIAILVALVLRPAPEQAAYAGVSVLLALSEKWHQGISWAPRDSDYGAPPSAEVRAEVYRTLQTSLQVNLAREAPVGFLYCLLTEMKQIERSEAIDAPSGKSKSSGEEAAGTANTTVTRGLEAVVAKLLQCFIKYRWNNVEAVEFLVDLISDGDYNDAVISCLPKEVKDTWNEGAGRHAGAVPVVVDLIQSLVVRGWSDGVDLLLDLALHYTIIDTRDAAIRSLSFLSNKQDLWAIIENGMKSRIQMLASERKTGDKIGHDSTRDNWKALLVSISTIASTRDFCSFVLDHIDDENIADQNLDLIPQVALASYTKQVEELSLCHNSQVRQAALGSLAKTVAESDSDATDVLKKLIALAFNAPNEHFRRSCISTLVEIASNVKSILPMVTAITDVDLEKFYSMSDVSWRKEWVTFLSTISRHGTYTDGLTALVQISQTDELWEVRVAAMQSLSRLAGDHSEAIITRTSLARNVNLRLWGAMSQARKAWTSTLSHLARMSQWKEGQEALIEMALRDPEREVRYQAYCEIDTLLRAGADRAAATLACLTSAFERIYSKDSYYTLSFADLSSTGDNHSYMPSLSIDLTSAFLCPLIKQVLVDSGVSYSLEQTLNSVALRTNLDHHKIILKCVIENLSSSSPYGATKVMELVSRIRQSSGRSWLIDPGSFAVWLPPLFHHNSKHVRAAAVDFLSFTYFGENHYAGSADVIVPLLVSVVFEDPDDGLRNEAADLLCFICASDYFAGRELATPVNIHRLLELLSLPRPLNTTVARLLGGLYPFIGAKEQIGPWIIDKVVIARDIPSNLEHGVLILLSELISKKRLDPDFPLDYLLLLLSSSLALKGTGETERHRPLILASLSLHYQNRSPDQFGYFFADLTRAFEYAAFGRHGTAAEAKAWLAMEQYLKEQPQPSQSQDARGSPRQPSIQAVEHEAYKNCRAEVDAEAGHARLSMDSSHQHPQSSHVQVVEDEERVNSREDIV